MNYLTCFKNQITELNLSNNSALTTVICSKNQLSELDISNNTALTTLVTRGNLLTELDLSDNSTLTTLDCSDNQLTFASLTTLQESWDTYIYAPQAKIKIAEVVGEDNTIDLRSQNEIDGTTTSYVWKTESGTTLSEGEDFSITDGVTTFLKSQSENVYCEMSNVAFPDFAGDNILKTTLTSVPVSTAVNNYATIDDLRIFPVGNSIILKTAYKGQVTIYDTTGKIIYHNNIHLGQNTISNIPFGIYIVRVNNINTQLTKKVAVR